MLCSSLDLSEGAGVFWSEFDQPGRLTTDSRRKEEIEVAAAHLQAEIWSRGRHLMGNTPSAFQLLDPRLMARYLGYSYEEQPDLDHFGSVREGHQVAGFVNKQRRIVGISTFFSLEVQRFTAAHEIGHIVLGHELPVLHRERPVKGTGNLQRREVHEEEADYFASCVLMPRGQMEAAFKTRFSATIREFQFDEHVAWQLCTNDPESIVRPYPGSKSRGLALARYSDRYPSLAKLFGVSAQVMAIRLEELGLCAEWP